MNFARTVFCFLLLPAIVAHAQTATWIAPASDSASGLMNWFDGANWSSNSVPNSATATALFTRASASSLALTSTPGSAIPRIDGVTVTLGTLRFALPEIPSGQRTSLEITSGGALQLQGGGVVLASADTFGVLNEINVGVASDLFFTGGATVQRGPGLSGTLAINLNGRLVTSGRGGGAYLHLAGNANLGTTTVATSSDVTNAIFFADESSAGSSSITLRWTGSARFNDHSSADRAQILAYSIAFLDDASAGNASLSLTPDLPQSNMRFADRASAGQANISLGKFGDVYFADHADAGTPTITVTGALNQISIRDDARTSGLGIVTASSGFGRLDISGANRDVELRALNGRIDVELGGRSLDFPLSADNAASALLGKISGAGGINWNRPAILTLGNADNNYTGLTLIQQGELRLANGRTAQTDIRNSARLTGSGIIAGNLSNGGLVSPGSSPGTITVQGNYSQAATGRLLMELASATDYDRLVVGGTASLAGSLTVSLLDGFMPVGSATFDLLTASSVTGQFTSTSVPADFGAALSNRLEYTATGVRLVMTQHPFAGFGQNTASAAFGGHLDILPATTSSETRSTVAILNRLNTTALAGALDALAPDRYDVLPEAGLFAVVSRQEARDRRFAALRLDGHRGWDLAFEAARRSATFDAIAGAPEADSTGNSGAVDLSWRSSRFSLGASLAQETNRVALDHLGGQAKLESLVPAVSVQYASDPWFLNASAAFAHHEYTLRRRIIYSGVDQTATASPSGRHTDVALTAGYGLQRGTWSFTPQAGILGADWVMDNFSETGATGANLTVSNWSARSWYARGGLTVAALRGNFRPQLTVLWSHAVRYNHSWQTALVGAGGPAYAAPGRRVGRDLIHAGIGFDWRLRRHASVTATLSTVHGKNSSVTSDVSAGFRWEF